MRGHEGSERNGEGLHQSAPVANRFLGTFPCDAHQSDKRTGLRAEQIDVWSDNFVFANSVDEVFAAT